MACWEGGKPGLSRMEPAHRAGRWAAALLIVNTRSVCLLACRDQNRLSFSQPQHRSSTAVTALAAPGVRWPSRRQCCRHSSALIASITWFFTSPGLEIEFLVIEIAAIS